MADYILKHKGAECDQINSGAYITVADIAERDARETSGKMTVGTLVRVESNGITYRWTGTAYVDATPASERYIGTRKIPVHFRNTAFEDKTNANQTGTIKQQVRLDSEWLGVDCIGIEAKWSNNYRDSFTSYLPIPNSVTIKASIEINGVIYPLYFGGSRLYSMASGEVVSNDYFDAIISKDDEVYIYTYFDAGVGGYIPGGYGLAFPGSVYEGKDGLEFGVDKVDSGGLVTSGDSAKSWGCCYVLSTPTQTALKSVLIIGDSIMTFGAGYDLERGSLGTDPVNSGYMAIALRNAGIPFTNISCSGERAYKFFDSIAARAPFTEGHDFVYGEYGINDINNGQTLEQLKASNIAIWQYYADAGLKVVWGTLMPFTTSTDNWYTEANQSTTGIETTRLQYNDWLLNDAQNEYPELLYAVIDINRTVDNGAGLWREWPVQHYGTAEVAGSTTTRIIDSSIPDSYDNGTWNSEGYVVITAGTNFGQPDNKILSYTKSAKRLVVEDPYPVPCDATTEYYIIRQPTGDGTHPRSGVANYRGAFVVDLDIFK